MTANHASGSEKVWASIEEEKRRDSFIRRVCKSAWVVTFVLVLLLGLGWGITMAEMVHLMGGVEGFGWLALLGAFLRVLIVLGILSLLIATLSTVGIFLRMRTTSLAEIQLRLAALEEILGARSEAS